MLREKLKRKSTEKIFREIIHPHLNRNGNPEIVQLTLYFASLHPNHYIHSPNPHASHPCPHAMSFYIY